MPLSKTSVSTSANLEVRSPKRLQVKFNQGSIATLQLLDNVDIPGELSIMGQRVDLQPIQPVLEPLKGVAQQGLSLAQELFKQLPKEASLPIQGDQAQTWLITTYLDDNLRISRGPRGSVFILTKASGGGDATSSYAVGATSKVCMPGQCCHRESCDGRQRACRTSRRGLPPGRRTGRRLRSFTRRRWRTTRARP